MDEPQSDVLEKSLESEDSLVETETTQTGSENQVVKKIKDNKIKKKDDRSVEVIKALSSLGTSEEKLAAMCKKYAEMVDENRKLQTQVKHVGKKMIMIQREKEQLQAEHSKTILTRSRLESLCRELQKQNKQIKGECLQRSKEEEETRKAVSNKFQSSLSRMTVLMEECNENNSKLKDENITLLKKLRDVCKQYELREQQVDKMTKQMQVESQLAEAKLAKLKMEMVAEKELLENDKKQLLMELEAYQHKCQELQKMEATLNSQINMYNEKYNKFQEALAKSNQLYNGFKGEIKNMSKKIAKLEKETAVWKAKWENDHQALLQVKSEKQQLARQSAQLQKLCRTLQEDRTSLLLQLKTEGITPKLSGDQNSTESNSQERGEKSEPNSITKEPQVASFQNGKSDGDGDGEGDEKMEKNAFAVDQIIPSLDQELEKDSATENDCLGHFETISTEKKVDAKVVEEKNVPQEVEVGNRFEEKRKEPSKTNSKSKTKKGKENSKKR